MNITFNWQNGELLNDIFSITISQKEGALALAKLLIKRSPITPNEIGIIKANDQIIFKGNILGIGKIIDNYMMEIELKSHIEDAQNKLTKLTDQFKEPPYYDKLFIDDDNAINPLEAVPFLPHWHRFDGTVNLSHIFKAPKTINISDYILKDSLKINIKNLPISEINLSLKAQWVQKIMGEFNLFPFIAAKFRDGYVNTLTPKQLLNFWPKIGTKIGRLKNKKLSGYEVVYSRIEQIKDIKSPPISVNFNGQTLQLKQNWFRGELWVHFRHNQNRGETATLTLKNNCQIAGVAKKIEINLQNIEDEIENPNDSSFFLSKRGGLAINHGLEIIKTHLMASSRCVVVECTLPFANFIDIDLNTNVEIINSLLPGSRIIGKIIEYIIEINDKSRLLHLKIGVMAGFVEDFMKDDEDQTNIKILDYQTQTPTLGINQKLKYSDIIKNIKVSGCGFAQTQALQNLDANADIMQILRDNPTKIMAEFLDLRTYKNLEHTINIDVVGPFNSPKNILLS